VIETIDNIISKSHQDELLDIVTDGSFDWHYLEDVTHEIADETRNNTPGFINLLVNDNGKQRSGKEHMFIAPLDEYLNRTNQKIVALHRMRLGLLLNNSTYDHNNKHVDYTFPHKVALYYLNDSDGDTVLWDNEAVTRVTPRKGRLCVFDGAIPHASSCPKEYSTRIVLTYNFNISEEK
tara:strand:- start:64 stop:600 length:537 start_codon:yes stop_codon:yes gene_type:complete